MTDQAKEERNQRITSAIGTGLVQALFGYALITGLGFEPISEVREQMQLFDIFEEPPPPPAELPPPDEAPAETQQTKDPEGAASPANLKDTPSPIVAPPPKIRLEVPPPVMAAPVAGQGNATSAGATDIKGPGTGSGGIGTGLGSGLRGTGTGGGGGGGRVTPAQWISGRIRDSDYPRAAFEANGGTVYLRFTVAPNGRVSACSVTRSGGHPALDATTCRLILQRFRYRPARDARGNPIASTVIGEHEWTNEWRTRHIILEETDPAYPGEVPEW